MYSNMFDPSAYTDPIFPFATQADLEKERRRVDIFFSDVCELCSHVNVVPSVILSFCWTVCPTYGELYYHAYYGQYS